MKKKIAVVIPCYRVTAHILTVIEKIPSEVWKIYCIDDCCPDGSGDKVAEAHQQNARITVIRRSTNGGVGAATKTGYEHALCDGADIIVKIDGDGQMDPRLIPLFVAPIVGGECDYTKGNRFYKVSSLRDMPFSRKLGNAGVSFLSKFSTGYWKLFDPSNGYTAIEATVLAELPLDSVHDRFFFEPDMLFRLGLVGACIEDIPMNSLYADEESNLSEWNALTVFPILHLRNFLKRLFYNYFLRGFSIASVHLMLGLILVVFGFYIGISAWIQSAETGVPATSGTVMLASFPLLIGNHLLLTFMGSDMSSTPSTPVHQKLRLRQQLIDQGRTDDR